MADVNVIGRNIQELMREQGLNPHRLAIEAKMGQSRVKDIITGAVRNPGVFTLQKVANSLGCTLDDLVRDFEVNLEDANVQA